MECESAFIFADPNLAVFLNADPDLDPALKPLLKNTCEELAVSEKTEKNC